MPKVVCELAGNDSCNCHGDCPHYWKHEDSAKCHGENDEGHYCEMVNLTVVCNPASTNPFHLQ